MKKCTAKKVYTLTHDAPNDEAFIAYADQVHTGMHGYGLDSLDIGDAMGTFIEYYDRIDKHGGSNLHMGNGNAFSVVITSDWDLFDWD